MRNVCCCGVCTAVPSRRADCQEEEEEGEEDAMIRNETMFGFIGWLPGRPCRVPCWNSSSTSLLFPRCCLNPPTPTTLYTQVERLQASTMSEEERRTLVSDVESARLNIAETERTLHVATTRNECLEEEIRAMRGETEGYTAKVLLL